MSRRLSRLLLKHGLAAGRTQVAVSQRGRTKRSGARIVHSRNVVALGRTPSRPCALAGLADKTADALLVAASAADKTHNGLCIASTSAATDRTSGRPSTPAETSCSGTTPASKRRSPSGCRTAAASPPRRSPGWSKAGRVQECLPAVAAACVAGEISADQVEVLAEVTTPEALDKATAADVDLTTIEAALVVVAVGAPYRELQKAVGTYVAALDPDGPEPDPTEGRSLSLVQHPDGAFTGGFTIDPVGGEKVATALEAIAARSRCAGDTRTRAQRLGDALVQLADLHLASGELPVLRTAKPHVGVLVGIEDLVDPSTGPGA